MIIIYFSSPSLGYGHNPYARKMLTRCWWWSANIQQSRDFGFDTIELLVQSFEIRFHPSGNGIARVNVLLDLPEQLAYFQDLVSGTHPQL